MARKPSVRYWESRRAYMCWFRGRQRKLAEGPEDSPTGPTYLEALDNFKSLMAGLAKGYQPTVREVLETYLRHISVKKKSGTVEIRLRSFKPFVDYHRDGACYGEKVVEKLSHIDVYNFLEYMRTVPRRPKRKKEQKGRKPVTWGPGSQRNCVLGLNAAFNWAVRSGMIQKNPLVGIEKPTPSSRVPESLIGHNADQIEKNHKRILDASPLSYRPFIQALKDTGARPGEIAAATAADFEPSMGAFVFQKEATRRGERFSHKTAKGRDRVIFLSGETLEHVKNLVKQFPIGPLFRRKGGRPFRKVNIVDRFMKLQKKLRFSSLTAYSYRHTFATEFLKAGMDADTLAELMGNSPGVIRQHYSHLLADAKGLREKLERFKKAAAGKQSSSHVGVADSDL